MNINKNKNLLRKAAYAPLAAAVLAGAVCAGAGIGSAATDADADVNSTADVGWTVINDTDQTLTGGKFHKHEVDSWTFPESTIDVTGLAPHESRSGTYQSTIFGLNYTRAENVCYNNLKWSSADTEWTPRDSWRTVHVRFDRGQLFIVPEGGGHYIILDPLKPYSPC